MPPLLHGALENFEAAYDAPTSALAHSLLAGMAIASDEEVFDLTLYLHLWLPFGNPYCRD